MISFELIFPLLLQNITQQFSSSIRFVRLLIIAAATVLKPIKTLAFPVSILLLVVFAKGKTPFFITFVYSS